eukprot:g4613.t1
MSTTVTAANAVYPGMVFILCFEIATKLYKAPFARYILQSYGDEAAPIVTGTVASATYVLQFLTAPAWGRLADRGYPRVMLAAALLAPLIPSIACLCVPTWASERAVIVTFCTATVLAGLCGSPLAVAFAMAKSLIRLKLDGNEESASRAMLLIMGCVPLGVLAGVVIQNIIEVKDSSLKRSLQEELNPLAITAVSVVAVMIFILFASGVLKRQFTQRLAVMSGGHDGYDEDRGDTEYTELQEDELPITRSRGESIVEVLSRKMPSPSFQCEKNGDDDENSDDDDTCVSKCSRTFIVVRWLRQPQFFLLAAAFAFVEFGHEGFFALHATSFLRSFPTARDMLHPVLELGAGLNALNILFLAPLFTYFGLKAYTKAMMAMVSMLLCYGLWATGILELTFLGELLGCMALMFKPSVTFIVTARLGSESNEAGEAIGALHSCGFVGAIFGIVGFLY